MSLKWIFISSDGRPRSLWRILMFLAVVILIFYSVSIFLVSYKVIPVQSTFFFFYIAVAVSTYLMLKLIDRRRFSSVGFPVHGKALHEIITGFLVGAVMISLVAGFELFVGAVKLSFRFDLSFLGHVQNFLLSFLFFLYFALGEELLFRGYVYQAMIEGTGEVPATMLMALVFGALHYGNPNATIFSTANTVLAGLWLSVAYLKTRALYLPFGMHFAWNFLQGYLFSLPVSGLLSNRTLFVPTDFGPDWLTGGVYGPEGGVGTTLVLLLATMTLMLNRHITPKYDYEKVKERFEKEVAG
ncbi:MAG: CPBP family intramembrane glutamic endopeptidase [Candidatus Kryptoniota bacterium]